VRDIEATSQRIQALGDRTRYRSPILAGTGMGAAVAYAALAQAPAATLAGAASDGFTTRIATQKPLCTEAPYAPAAEGGFSYGPHPLPGWWRVAPAPDELAAAREFAAAVGLGADAIVAPPAGGDLAERLVALLADKIAAEPAPSSTLEDLPLVELPTAAAGALMAVIYSGDGGWRDIDKQIGGYLQDKGLPVVGVDSLRYFWSAKTPEQVAADLASILDHYQEAWRRPQALLIGYSFGADILPFAYNRLPDALQEGVRRLSLLALSRTADFEIHVAGWLGLESDAGALPTAPELRRLPVRRVQCFYGEEEEDSACMMPELDGAERVRTKGGHHFDGDYEAIAQAILRGVAPSPP
jgi:type IV secretory pathway VirJ component